MVGDRVNDSPALDFFNRIQLSNINGIMENIDVNIKNIKDIEIARTYAKIISAENDINQSYYENDDTIQKYIQCSAQSKINEGISVLQQDFINIIKYFVDWDNMDFISRNFGNRKYSQDNIKRNINQLCNDYLYLKKGIILLIKLKKFQGTEKCILEESEKLKAFEDMIYMNEIYNWLPPENEENSWQHQLLYGRKYKELSTEKLSYKLKLKSHMISYLKRKGKNKNGMQK